MHSALENVILTEADTGGACVISLSKVARTGILAITVVDSYLQWNVWDRVAEWVLVFVTAGGCSDSLV